MIPGVGVFFATGGGISISLVAGVLLLLAGGSLRERAAHQASRETELPPPPEYFETYCSRVPIVDIPTDRIIDWNSFHDVFSELLGFPEFHGRNMNAWIDCLTDVDDDPPPT
jgi:Barstar (barnase inhibitor)